MIFSKKLFELKHLVKFKQIKMYSIEVVVEKYNAEKWVK